MKAYAIAGRPGAGKTFLTKHLVALIGVPPFVYDTNREWGAKHLPEMEAFLDQCLKRTNSVLVFEDATVFFSTTGSDRKLKRLLVAKRHSRNTIFLLFHGLRQIPLYVLDLVNGVIVLRTNDAQANVESRFSNWPAIIEAWKNVNDTPMEEEAHPSQYVEL